MENQDDQASQEGTVPPIPKAESLYKYRNIPDYSPALNPHTMSSLLDAYQGKIFQLFIVKKKTLKETIAVLEEEHDVSCS